MIKQRCLISEHKYVYARCDSRLGPGRPRHWPGCSTSSRPHFGSDSPASRVPVSSPFRSNFLSTSKQLSGGSTTRSLGSEKRSASFSLFPLCVSFHTPATLPAFQKCFCQNILTAVLLRPTKIPSAAQKAAPLN